MSASRNLPLHSCLSAFGQTRPHQHIHLHQPQNIPWLTPLTEHYISSSRAKRSPGYPGLALVAAPDGRAFGQERTMTLSDTQSSILRQALHHPDELVVSPAHLPPEPLALIARALLNTGLVARAEPSSGSWKLDGEVRVGRPRASVGRRRTVTDVGRNSLAALLLDGAATISFAQSMQLLVSDRSAEGPAIRTRLSVKSHNTKRRIPVS